MSYLTDLAKRTELHAFYQKTLLDDVMPFWLRHGMDCEHDGIITTLDRDGSVLDSDKSIWFQGRAGWTFATLFNTLEKRREYFDAAGSCIAFLDKHGYATDGKLFFTVTREGRPLRMRRYVYSEAFAAIAHAAYFKATQDELYHQAALQDFATYLRHSFEPGLMTPKVNSETRPMIGIAADDRYRHSPGTARKPRSCGDLRPQRHGVDRPIHLRNSAAFFQSRPRCPHGNRGSRRQPYGSS
jgi:N-acylglucosamine 2-epimerase